MFLLENLHILAWVYGLGFLAAAPVGPVNMVAVHRGVIGKWSHTLACGLGSATIDLMYFALAIWGGEHLKEYLQDPHIQKVLAAACAGVLLPLGILMVVRSYRMNLRALVRSRRKMRNRLPRHLWTDVGTGIMLTVINPAVPIYWLTASAPWIAQAPSSLGPGAMWWGLIAAAAGLCTWFFFLTFLVRFRPERLGPAFFRIVNGICGVLLLCVAAALCISLIVGLLR